MTVERRRALPGAGAGLAAGALALTAILSWRFAPAPLAGSLAVVAVIASWFAGRRFAGDRRWLEHAIALPLLVSALLLIARNQPTWWPCDLACAGGKAYERLFGLPVVAIAFTAGLALQLALGGCHLWCRPREAVDDLPLPTPLPIQIATWALIGASLFYLWTALRLGLACRQCLAYHTAVFVLVGPLRAGHLRVATRMAALMLGFLALLAAYGPALRVDIEPDRPQPADIDAVERAWAERADAGRCIGRGDAPATLELGIDFQCPHCADGWDALMKALTPLIDDGRLRVVVRHVVRASEPASPELARWAFAAAATGRHRAFVAGMLGSRGGASAAELLRSPNAQAIGLEAIAREASAHEAGAARCVEADKARLKQLRFAGRTPLAVLLLARGATESHELGRWSGDVDPQAIASAATAAAGTTAGGTP